MGESAIRDFGGISLPDTIEISVHQGGKRAIPLIAFPSVADIHGWEEKWAEHGRSPKHLWRWNNKLRMLPGYRYGLFLALAEGTNCHGMMIVSWPSAARGGDGNILYIDYLEVGPQNQNCSDAGEKRELEGIGTTFLALAKDPLSKALGLSGFGLHAPGAAVDGFCTAYGMNEFAEDNGLTYFELTG